MRFIQYNQIIVRCDVVGCCMMMLWKVLLLSVSYLFFCMRASDSHRFAHGDTLYKTEILWYGFRNSKPACRNICRLIGRLLFILQAFCSLPEHLFSSRYWSVYHLKPQCHIELDPVLHTRCSIYKYKPGKFSVLFLLVDGLTMLFLLTKFWRRFEKIIFIWMRYFLKTLPDFGKYVVWKWRISFTISIGYDFPRRMKKIPSYNNGLSRWKLVICNPPVCNLLAAARGFLCTPKRSAPTSIWTKNNIVQT